MAIAKVIRHGRNQAIRLPKEFHIDADEVYLKRTPEGFLVILRDPWKLFFEGVKDLSDNFGEEGRRQLPIQRRRSRRRTD
jgi:virulence-associated protein VagC